MCVLFVTWKKVSEEELKQQNFASPCILHIVVNFNPKKFIG